MKKATLKSQMKRKDLGIQKKAFIIIIICFLINVFLFLIKQNMDKRGLGQSTAALNLWYIQHKYQHATAKALIQKNKDLSGLY